MPPHSRGPRITSFKETGGFHMNTKVKVASRSQRRKLISTVVQKKPDMSLPVATGSTLNEVALLADLRSLIRSARQRVATVANSTQTMLYSYVGRLRLKESLQDGRAAYGKQILVTVSQELKAEFGDGFSYSALTRMVRFAETFGDQSIVVALSQELSWSHFLAILPIKDPLAREFCAEMCRIERWDVRTFREKIGSMLFQGARDGQSGSARAQGKEGFERVEAQFIEERYLMSLPDMTVDRNADDIVLRIGGTNRLS